MSNDIASLEAEMALLGGMIMEPYRVVLAARDRFKLPERAFADQRVRRVVNTLYGMMGDTSVRSVNIVTLKDRLNLLEWYDDAVFEEFLDDCMDKCVIGHTESLCDVIRQKWILRECVAEALQIGADARKCKRGDKLLNEIPARFMKIADQVVNDESSAEVLDRIIAGYRLAAENENYLPGLSSGWREFDDVANGFEPGMIIIAGRPGQGKTTIEDCVACHVAANYGAVARVTMDMTRKDLLERELCRMSGVSMPKLRRGFVKVGSAQWDQVNNHRMTVEGLPLHILEGENDLNAIATWLRMMKLKHDIKLFSVDYVQQIYTGVPGIDANENVRITKVSSELKKLCLNLKVPGLILSQLNRGSSRDGSTPTLHDLRGSGSIEQDADMVIMSYQNSDEALSTKKIRAQFVEIVKNKNGMTGKLPFWFHAPYFRFEALPCGCGHEDVKPGRFESSADAGRGALPKPELDVDLDNEPEFPEGD